MKKPSEEYVVMLASAVANGMKMVDFQYFCFCNGLDECPMSLKLFLNGCAQNA